MTDRKSFLDAIRENPLDDTARLVYADWLGDHGEGDLDAATAEFIRVSCSRGGVVMPKAAYAWIHEHWKRLIPTAIKKHPKHYVAEKKGRVISLRWARRTGTCYSARLHYCRGFVQRVDAWAWPLRASDGPLEAIKIDQPFTGLYAREKVARVDALQRAADDTVKEAAEARREWIEETDNQKGES